MKAQISRLIKLSALNLTILSALIFVLAVFPTSAQEATNSSVNQEEVKEKIKERLEEVVDSDFAEVEKEISKAKVYSRLGAVKSLEDNKFLLELEDDQTEEVVVATDAAILKTIPGKEKKNLGLEEIEKGDYLITMGFISQDGKLFLAKRVVIAQAPEPAEEKQLLFGKVTEIDSNKVTIQNNGDKETITIDSKKTQLKIKDIDRPLVEDINIEDRIAVIYTLKKEKIDIVKAVLVIPGKNSPESKENEVKE